MKKFEESLIFRLPEVFYREYNRAIILTRIIGVASGKGGVGKTTVSTNIGLALRDFGKKVLVVDCNLSTPHLAYYLGVSNYKYTLNDALKGKVDINSTTHLKDGIRYIPASLDLKDISGINMMKLKDHIDKIDKNKYDFIILDSAPGLSSEALTVLNSADEILFVTTPFIPMVNDVIRSSEILKKLKGTKSVSVVMNMITDGLHEIFSKSVANFTGFPVVGEIQYDKNIIYGLTARSPVVNYKPNSGASINFRSLAARLIGEEYNVPKMHKIKRSMKKLKNRLSPRKVVMMQSNEDLLEDLKIQPQI